MTDLDTPATARRPESLIGVCRSLGEDFGFNPDYLRVLLMIAMLLRPEATLIAYGVLGLIVLASRLIYREPKTPHAIG